MKYFYFSCLILVIWACRATPSVRPELDLTNVTLQKDVTVDRNDNTSADQNIEGLYFGVSDNQLGQRAWLLRLEKGKGILYMPPGNLIISRVEVSSTKHINFQSNAGLGDVAYNFIGQVVSNTIQGEFQFSPAGLSNEKRVTAEVLLQRIDASSLNDKNVSGLYSNVQYVEEGGDLVGDDLILIPYDEKLIGIFTSYENEMTPYAVDILQQGNKIRFNMNTENGEQSFQGLTSSKEVKLWHNDTTANSETELIILFKKQKLSDVLTKADKF